MFRFEDVIENVEIEDGGQAQIVELDHGAEEGLFVRLQSWSTAREHPEMDKLRGRRVRVSIEVI